MVMKYIGHLDKQEYDRALACLDEKVRIRGPGGESFGKPFDFIDMLRRYRGRYDLKKVFSDGADVCVLYDLVTAGASVYMASWYQVEEGRIVSIRTAFDPQAFVPPPGSKSTTQA